MQYPITLLLPLFTILPLSTAQDACGKLPLTGHVNLPLPSYPPGSLIPTNTTLCQKYAPKDSTQLDWITRVINMAFVGNYAPVIGPKWPQDPNGTYQGTGFLDPHARYRGPCNDVYDVNLLQYFNGSLLSTNRHGRAVALNFLDGGGEAALRQNISAFDKHSNQHHLLVSFYAYFGYFFGCTDGSVPRYGGGSSQTIVHRFMDLPAPYVHYFIHNIVDAATSLGVEAADTVTHVGDGISIGIALDNTFNKRCSPSERVVPWQEEGLQSLCSDVVSCAPWTYANATCNAYNLTDYGVFPSPALEQDGGDHHREPHWMQSRRWVG